VSNANSPPWGAKRKVAAAVRARTVLTLFSGRDDVDSHRVRLVLAAKAVSYDLVVVDAAKPPEDLIELNPYNDVPTLADRELALYDVDVICEYLDERYPHPPLLPIDPLSRARVRLAVRRVERDWLSLMGTIQTGAKAAAEGARRRLRDGLVATLPAFKASKFFLNPEMSLADCALAPLIWRLPSLAVQLPKEAQPIIDYGDRIFRNPAFTRSMTNVEKSLRP
jgi:RNA polymerase-associated protein